MNKSVFIWAGIVLSLMVGLLVGLASFVLFQSKGVSAFVFIVGFIASCDVCFRGKNG